MAFNRPDMGDRDHIVEGLNDSRDGDNEGDVGNVLASLGGLNTGDPIFFGSDSGDDVRKKTKLSLDTDDLDLLGYGPSYIELFEGIGDVHEAVFALDYDGLFIDRALRDTGEFSVDEIHASELVIGGEPSFGGARSVSVVRPGFQVLESRGLQSWSKQAPAAKPPLVKFPGKLDDRKYGDLQASMNRRLKHRARMGIPTD